MIRNVSIVSLPLFVAFIVLGLKQCSSFVSPPTSALSSLTGISDSVSVGAVPVANKPTFRDTFFSYWDYWEAISGNYIEHTGSMLWAKNYSQMYYHFVVPSKGEWFELIESNRMYLWSNNSTCKRFDFDFSFVDDFWSNASYGGLTDEPYITVTNLFSSNQRRRQLNS